MADKLYEIDSELDRLSKDFYKLMSRFARVESNVEALHREVGAQEGRSLFQQINELESKFLQFERQMTGMERDLQAIRKLTEYGDTRLQEIMKALSLIYQNTDELEPKLLQESGLDEI